ncbi:hypothetical protein H671_6g16924 [Cricetulus griseus]|nr:hypothetical protein H671_6g16924 [Cricetulus griseus]
MTQCLAVGDCFCFEQRLDEGSKMATKFVYMVDYFDGFLYFEPSLYPWDEAYLIIVDDFSDVLLYLIRQYFVEYFYIDVHEGYWSVVLFLVVSSCGLGIKVIVAS